MSDNDWTGDFAGISTPAPSWNPKRPLRIALLGDVYLKTAVLTHLGAGDVGSAGRRVAELTRERTTRRESRSATSQGAQRPGLHGGGYHRDDAPQRGAGRARLRVRGGTSLNDEATGQAALDEDAQVQCAARVR